MLPPKLHIHRTKKFERSSSIHQTRHLEEQISANAFEELEEELMTAHENAGSVPEPEIVQTEKSPVKPMFVEGGGSPEGEIQAAVHRLSECQGR